MENEPTNAAEPQPEPSTVAQFAAVGRHKSPTHLSTWADNAEVSINFFDVKIIFSEVVNVDREAKTMEIEQKVTVAMSPEHALALLVILEQQMQVFTQRFGDLRALPHPSEQGQEGSKTPEV